MDKTKPTRPRKPKAKQPSRQAAIQPDPNSLGTAGKPPANKYAQKDRIGANPPIRVGGQKVTRVGLGNLIVEDIDGRTYSQY